MPYAGPESSAQRSELLKALRAVFLELQAEGRQLADAERQAYRTGDRAQGSIVRCKRTMLHAPKVAAAQHLRDAIRHNGHFKSQIVARTSQIAGHAESAFEKLMMTMPYWKDLVTDDRIGSKRFEYDLILPLNYGNERRPVYYDQELRMQWRGGVPDLVSQIFNRFKRRIAPHVKYWSIGVTHSEGCRFREMVEKKPPYYLNGYFSMTDCGSLQKSQIDPKLVEMVIGKDAYEPRYYTYPVNVNRLLRPTLIRGYAVKLVEVGEYYVTAERGFLDVILDTCEVEGDSLVNYVDGNGHTLSLNRRPAVIEARMPDAEGNMRRTKLAFVPLENNPIESAHTATHYYGPLVWKLIEDKILPLS